MVGFANRFLRQPPSGALARSAYAVEVNPWSTQEDTEAALFFRGVIVSSFGYIETRIGEVCIRASRLDAYAGLRERFPHSTAKRVTFLRRVFSTGPLSSWADTASRFLDRFDATEELRNLAAHGRMQVLPGWGMTLHDFPSAGPEGIQVRSRRLTMAEIEDQAWRAARLSRLCQHLYDLLEETGTLPTFE